MTTRLRSIIEEIADYAPKRDTDLFIESRAQQVVASASHLMRLIRENYDTDTADELTKRLVLAIKNDDEERFTKRVRKLRESRTKRLPTD